LVIEHTAGPVTQDGIRQAGLDWLLTTSFLGHLDDESQNAFLARMRWREYGTDEVIIASGGRSDGVQLIVRGEVRVDGTGPAGKPRALARLGPGDMVGETSIVKQTPSKASVRSLSPVRSLFTSAADFEWMLAQSNDFRTYVDDLIELRDNSERLIGLLLRNPFLRSLGRTGIEGLIQSGRMLSVPTGGQIIRAGEHTTDAYVVYTGQVAVFAKAEDDRPPEKLTTEGPGWLFGHAAALLDTARSADVTAVAPTRVIQWSGQTLMAIVNRNPPLRRRMYQALAATPLPLNNEIDSRTQLVSLFGVRNGAGTTTAAYGLAACLASHSSVTLVDIAGAQSMERLGFTSIRDRVRNVHVFRMQVPEHWKFQVVWPVKAENTVKLMSALQEQQRDYVLVAAESRNNLDVAAMSAAETVIFVRKARDGTHEEAAERGQRRIDAIRIHRGAVLPLETTSRGHVRIPNDGRAVGAFWRHGDLSALTDSRTLFGQSMARLERVLRGRSVGLALGGGGAFGFAHLGLLQALDEASIPVDYIAGASFGALVGGLYAAAGLSTARELIKRRGLLSRRTTMGMVFKHQFEKFVDGVIGDVKIGETLIPFYPVAVDVLTGTQIIPAHGTIGYGVQCSSGLPPLFPALETGNRRLVDGGIDNNVPASVVWDAGAHFILGSNVIPWGGHGSGYLSQNWFDRRFTRARDLVRAAYHLMAQNGRDRAQLADYVFEVRSGDFTLLDFNKGAQIAEAGYRQAVSEMSEIKYAYENF
jgi:predicted acylesterase/phospholipase RssA/CRP-like cAMP-binding protein